MKEVSAALIVRNDKVFIAQRPKGKPLPDLWEFPGGKQEEGETLPQCLKRELKEELDVNAEVGEFLMDTTYAYPNGEFRINLYRVHIPDGEEPKLNVHQNATWISPAEMKNFEFPPADKEIISYLQTIKL